MQPSTDSSATNGTADMVATDDTANVVNMKGFDGTNGVDSLGGAPSSRIELSMNPSLEDLQGDEQRRVLDTVSKVRKCVSMLCKHPQAMCNTPCCSAPILCSHGYSCSKPNDVLTYRRDFKLLGFLGRLLGAYWPYSWGAYHQFRCFFIYSISQLAFLNGLLMVSLL